MCYILYVGFIYMLQYIILGFANIYEMDVIA